MNIATRTTLFLLLTPLLTPASSAGVSECSTPDPRNVYDYCLVADETTQGLAAFRATSDTMSPVCFPVPVLGSICPEVPDLDDTGLELYGVSARLTYIEASTTLHAQVLWGYVCGALGASCAYLPPITVGDTLPVALADRTFDGVPDGLAVRVDMGFCYQSSCTTGPTWFYLGA